MKKILSQFVKHPFYGKVFIITLILFGIVSMMDMNKAYFPIVDSKTISVAVSYQGATPKEMEEGVVSLLENSIRGIVGIKEHSSTSQENSARLNITIQNGYDIDKVVYDVKNAIDAISNFPAGAERPVVSKGRTTTIAAFLFLTSKSDDLILLRNEANAIEDEILTSGVISQISQRGLPSRLEMSIEVDENSLQRHGLTHEKVRQAIATYNVDSYGGIIKSPTEQIKINLRNRSVDPKDIEDIIVSSSTDGALVRVKDVATVAYQFEDVPQTSYIDNKRNVLLMISNIKEEDLESTSKYLKKYVAEYNEANPDMNLEIVRDFMDILDGQLSILYSNGIQGILLVILSLSLFLNFRMSLWVAWGIPASFLGMFIVGSLLGLSLNFISLFGMILIIGILVDDGIVIGENIFTYYEKGYSPQVAAIKGTLEVLPAILVSVSTTIVAFIPILFIEGNLEMMYEMAVVVIACLVVSVIEGVFVLPGHLASKSILAPLPEKSLYGKVRNTFDKGLYYVCDNIYLPYLRWAMGKKVVVMAIVTGLFVVTFGMFMGGRLRFTFFPPSNEENFSIDVAMKPGTSTENVLDVLKYIEAETKVVDSMLAEKYGEDLFIRKYSIQTGSSFSGNESGEHAGIVRLFLRGLDESQVSSEMIKKAIAERIPSIPKVYKFAIGASSRFGAPVSISLFSRNTETLTAASESLKNELGKRSALYNVMDNNQLGTREIHLKLKPLAYTLGITPQMVMSQVRAAFFGSLTQRIQEGRNEIWFYVRYPEENSQDVGHLENLNIRTPDGGEYPLYQLCDFKLERGVTKINHYNGKKEIRVEAFMLDPKESVLPILDDISNNIMPALMEKYPDISYMYQGQVKDSGESVQSSSLIFLLAFTVMMLIIVTHFKSFVQGILIILMVPIAVIAAIWGHVIEGEILSMMSIWGMVALSGTVINNAVVFMERYNGLLLQGKTSLQSIIDSGRSRFRPIILTSVTTIMGLFPLINETSSDARFVKPMAISLGYGILLGTIFILAIFPVLLNIVNKMLYYKARLMGDKDATHESVETAIRNKKIEDQIDEDLEKALD